MTRGRWAALLAAAAISLALVAGLPASAHHKPGHGTTTTSATTTTLAPTTTTVAPTTTTVAPTTTTLPSTTTTVGPTTTTGPGPALPTISHYANNPTDPGTFAERHTSAEAKYGPFQRWRDFVPDGGTWPKSSWLAALDGGQGVFANVKPQAAGGTWASVAAGQRDPQIIAGFQSLATHCPGMIDTPARDALCWVTFAHEPADNIGPPGFSVADYVAMWRHLDDLRDLHAPQVKLVWTMESWDIGPDSPYPSLYPGDESVDVLGLDPYISATEPSAELAQKMVERAAWFHATFPAKPLALPEWGTDLNGVRGTVEHRRAAVAEVHRRIGEIAAQGVIDLAYFESREYWFESATSPDGLAYRALSDLLAP